MKIIDVEKARQALHADTEIGFIDVREPGQFIEGHAMFAVPLAYSTLEARASEMLPRLDAPLLLIDDGDGIAGRAADNLENLGYSNISIIAGGMPDWIKAGFPVYKGVNVPSKTLGEMAEEIWHPQMMTPDRLAAELEGGNAPLFTDCRPQNEYLKMSVPGAVCVPNGELAHRIDMLMPEHTDKPPVIITCAGRTRGIIGSIGLKLSGYQGPVYALENGTQGWALSGRQLERGNTAAPLPQLGEAAKDKSRRAAANLIKRFDLSKVDKREALELAADSARTTYVFDLRTRKEAADLPVAGAKIVPGVQLVQATDQYAGMRRARMILCCDTGLRSAIAAFWLTQLGYEPHILVLDECKAMPHFPAPEKKSAQWIPPVIAAEKAKELLPDALLIDVCGSKEYRAGHAEGAIWGIRPRLGCILNGENADRFVIFIDDGGKDVRAALCAKDASAMGYKHVFVVENGYGDMDALTIESTPDDPPDCERIDFAFFVHDRHDGNLDASREYLRWETGLINQLDEAERSEFKLIRP